MQKKLNTAPLLYIYRTVLFITLFLTIFSLASNEFNNANFNPVNGDFQTFNPIRRMLDGQSPMVDFNCYLGAGVNFSLYILNLIFGGTLVQSKIIATFVSAAFSSSIVLSTSYIITKNLNKALVITNALVLFLILFPKVFIGDNFFIPGNSLAPVRIALPALITCFALIFNKFASTKIKDAIYKKSSFITPVLIGVVSALGRFWCNDVGLAALIVMSGIYFVVTAEFKFKFILRLLTLVASYLVFVIIFGFLFFGIDGFPIWVDYNSVIGSMGSYQIWYFSIGRHKLYTIRDVINIMLANNRITWIVLGLCVLALLRCSFFNKEIKISKFKIKKMSKQTSILCIFFAFILGTLYLSNLVYQVKSNAYPRYLGALFVIVATIVVSYAYKLYDFILSKTPTKVQNFFEIAVPTLLVLAIVSQSTIKYCMYFSRPHNDNYSEQLGGNSIHTDYLEKCAEFIGDETVFSTYASALELYQGTYQPTGTDYIIHVLGDENREKYLQDYIDLDPTYTTTQVSIYENWVMRANWFWYRELLSTHAPLDMSLTNGRDYLIFWTKSEESLATEVPEDLQITLDGTTIKFKSESMVGKEGILDLELNYTTSFNSVLDRLKCINSQIEVKDYWTDFSQALSTYGLPAGEDVKLNIPVYIDNNGEGFIEISLFPSAHISIDFKEIKPTAVLPIYDFFKEGADYGQ